jgi:hypothetical protein
VNKKIDIDDKLKAEWRTLQFYYELDETSKEWKIFGSKGGIENFASILRDYCKQNANQNISEHIHLGPYSYLKIMTWDKPLISVSFIAGRVVDLERIGSFIRKKIQNLNPGDKFSIDKEYSNENEAKITIEIMADDFDPVSMDDQLRG